jgi:hypothetical protein
VKRIAGARFSRINQKEKVCFRRESALELQMPCKLSREIKVQQILHARR